MTPNPNASSSRPGESPFHGGFEPLAPPPKRRSCLWLSIGCLGVGFLGLIVCCGVGTLGLQQQGHMIFEPVRMELNQMPDVTSEVGQIERLSMNFSETVKEFENDQRFILDATTTQGDFKFSVKQDDTGGVESAEMIRPDGTRKAINTDPSVRQPVVIPAPGNAAPDSDNAASEPAVKSESAAGPKADAEPIDSVERELRELEAAIDLN